MSSREKQEVPGLTRIAIKDCNILSDEILEKNTVMNSLREKQEEFREDLDNLRQGVDQETNKLEEAKTEMDHWLFKL